MIRAMEIITLPLYLISIPFAYLYWGMAWAVKKWWTPDDIFW